jgi:hypothetical protein
MLEEFDQLLQREWTDEERQMIERIKEGILFYKRLIPKSLREDVIAALQLCNTLKQQLEDVVKPRED